MPSNRKISFIDRILAKLPEIHIRGYSFCGPNTNLQIRLAHGERGVNALDCACMEHDIAYTESKNLKSRSKADKLLVLKAIKRIFAKDSQHGERFAAMIVSWLISIKLLLSKVEICIDSVRMCLAKKSLKKQQEKEDNVDDEYC